MLVPSGWEVVQNKKESGVDRVVLDNPSTAPNALELDGGQFSSATNASSILQAILSGFQKQYPDTVTCAKESAAKIGGVTGSMEGFCFTVTPQGGAAIRCLAIVWAGTPPDGMTGYVLELISAASNKSFYDKSGDVIDTIQWVGGAGNAGT